MWMESRLRTERKIDSYEAREIVPQRLGRLMATRENPVSSIENQTAWVSCPGFELEREYSELGEEDVLCTSTADFPSDPSGRDVVREKAVPHHGDTYRSQG